MILTFSLETTINIQHEKRKKSSTKSHYKKRSTRNTRAENIYEEIEQKGVIQELMEQQLKHNIKQLKFENQ